MSAEAAGDGERETRVPSGRWPKAHRRGGHRALPPAETLGRLVPLLPELGITRVGMVTGLDVIGIPVAQAMRPNSRSNAVFQGKGLDLDAAKASAIMEAVETFHAERILKPMRFAGAADLAAAVRLMDIEGLPRMRMSPYHPHLEMLWIEGEDLLTSEPVWAPYECVHARFTIPYPPGSGCFACTTNGLSSGNHRLEALVHGICEIVERDAMALFERTPPARGTRRVDPTSVDDVDCLAVIDAVWRAGLDLAIWDLTTDIGAAVFGCRIFEKPDGPGLVALPAEGHGCHPDRSIALLRALTEAAQTRLTAIAGGRDDIGRPRYREAEWMAAWREHLAREPCGRRFADVPTHVFETFDAELAWLLRQLRSCGIEEAVAVDLGPAGAPYAVTRVIVPGLEGLPESGCLPGRRAAGV